MTTCTDKGVAGTRRRSGAGAPGVDDFGQRLLNHVEMLYRIAVNLTRDPHEAERITRNALCHAWGNRDRLRGSRRLKAELLKLLRRTFLSGASPGHSADIVFPPALCPAEATADGNGNRRHRFSADPDRFTTAS